MSYLGVFVVVLIKGKPDPMCETNKSSFAFLCDTVACMQHG